MNKERIKGFILGVLVTAMIFASVIIAAANSETFTKQITYGINVMVNGEQAEFAEDMRPFVMDNRTFLPLRGIGELLGLPVDYDPETHTAIVGEMPEEEEIPATITIKGVEYSTDLTELELWNKGLTNEDIEPLKYMTNLTSLILGGNEISDISALSGVINLTELHIHNNQISDISILSNLTNLTTLSIHNNSIRDINVLNSLINLTILNVSCNDININVLSDLTNLFALTLMGDGLSDISALSSLINLKVLSIHYSEVSDISVLSNLTDLMALELSNNLISDINVLSDLTDLRVLGLSCNEISDISALSGLINLGYLFLRDNPLTEEQIAEIQAALPECEIYFED